MHGFGMSLNFDEETLRIGAQLAYTRPFSEIKANENPFGKEKSTWWSIEGINKKEKLAIKILNSPKKH